MLAFNAETPKDIVESEPGVFILGTLYRIVFKDSIGDMDDQCYNQENSIGLTAPNDRVICVSTKGIEWDPEISPEAWNRSLCHTLRHEILHAFFYESGLWCDSYVYKNPWPMNEEMIDWFAIMSPKIFKVYQKLNIIDLE